MIKRYLLTSLLMAALFVACTPVDLNASVPVFETGVDPNSWSIVPAGAFLSGQYDEPTNIPYDYEIMVTDVTVSQFVSYVNIALADGTLKVDAGQVVGYYHGDEFHGAKHELPFPAGEYIYIPIDDPASRFTYSDPQFQAVPGYENHPMTNVSWFGAWGYCGYNSYRLPTELEWEKAARGSADNRPYPWGQRLALNNANYYKSRDPFENMSSFGSRTTPVGFYNGQSYRGYQTLDSASPYGLYDMAGNVWQWTSNVYEGQHYRYLRGGSKDTYDMDLRIWVKNNATPTYYSPDVGFRCARGVD